MHAQISRLDILWAQHLEGSYFPKNVLRDDARPGDQLWYLDHGSHALIRSDHCNTVLVRWVVREQGVILAGPAPESIRATIQQWGQETLHSPAPFNNRFYQGFIVLNYCRMLHDLSRGAPGSKLADARWAQASLDPSFHELIDRAWDGRPNPAASVREPASLKDFQETLELSEQSEYVRI